MKFKKKSLPIASKDYLEWVLEKEEEKIAEKDLMEKKRPKKRKPRRDK
jgi:hypothetical protein